MYQVSFDSVKNSVYFLDPLIKYRPLLSSSLLSAYNLHSEPYQWRIQDFPGSTNLLFGIILSKSA